MSVAKEFHNVPAPSWNIQTERPRHRLACQMSINGFNNREIAKALGYEEAWVSAILRQPWAQSYMAQELQDKGDDMREQIMAAGKDAFVRIVDLSKTAKSEAVKLQSNQELMNRWLGKAVQPIQELNKPEVDMSDDELKVGLNTLLRKAQCSEGAPNSRDNQSFGSLSDQPPRESVPTSFPLDNNLED